MTEKSTFWTTSGVGDGPLAGYTAADFYNFMRRLLITDQEASQGVLRGVLNELAVTGSSSPLTVASGAAIVYGIFYSNSSPVSLAVGTPVTSTTGFRINLQADWNTQTIRAVVQVNTDGTPDIPALVQTAGDEWNIPLATGTITQAGAIALTSAREYCQFAEYLTADMIDALAGLSVVGRASSSEGAAAAITAASDGQVLRRASGVVGWGTVETAGIADDAVTNDKLADNAIDTDQIIDGAITTAKLADNAVDDTKVGERIPQFYRRQGGSASDWSSSGANNYTPGAVRMQAGIIDVTVPAASYSASQAVTFPVAFSDKPVVIVTTISTSSTYLFASRATSVAASGFSAAVNRGNASGDLTVSVAWIAIGPE